MATGHKITLMRPVAFGEALPAGTRLTLFSDDKPDRFFTVSRKQILLGQPAAISGTSSRPGFSAYSRF